QTNAGIRDLTGLCLFDEQAVTVVRPSRTRAQVTQMLHLLADAAALTPSAGRADPEALLPLAYTFAQEVYPDLLRADLNPPPSWTTWFMSFPGNPRGGRGFWERLYHYKGSIFFLFSGFLGAGLLWLPEVFVPPFALLALGFHSALESLEAPPEAAS